MPETVISRFQQEAAVRLKVYLVSQAVDPNHPEQGEIPIAARLTFKAAMAVAKLDGGRRVRLFIATKELTPDG